MNGDNEVLEPTLDVELSPMMEMTPNVADSTPASATPPRRYWQAQGLANMLQSEFDEAHELNKSAVMRERFYLLANYYMRTLAILRYALRERREPLAQAALHNLIALHKSLHHMHTTAPAAVPSTLALNREIRPRLMENLIVQILQDAPGPLDLPTITQRVNDLDVLANASDQVIRRHVGNLVSTGHLELLNDKYVCTTRRYSPLNLDQAALQTLLGPALSPLFDQQGFYSIADVAAHKSEFRTLFVNLTNFNDGTAVLFVAAAEELMEPRTGGLQLSSWGNADLIGSPHVRPYQYEAYAIFRGYGYQGQVIEAPTGSGKTMIGMMCIQDWLRSMSQGQSILVLVPTVNYQQQWLGELCYKPIGLGLSPHQVYTGTPATLETTRIRTGISPCVIVMTYTALAQTGSGIGKGGFDQDSIEIFLQGNNIQYVILDEVHKVVEDMRSVSADVTRLMVDWVRDSSLKGAIGFSGTAAAYRSHFTQLGLQLVYIMPAAELIAYGFVAPFAEFGVPFAYSGREQQVRNLLDAYKAHVRDFLTLIGSANLRRWFADIPLDERLTMGRDLLRMYSGQKNQDEALAKRFQAWENNRELNMTELPLVTLVQLAKGWSDEDMVRAAYDQDDSDRSNKLEQFHELLLKLQAIRDELKSLIYLANTVRRLNSQEFGTSLNVSVLRQLTLEPMSIAARVERVKDELATTIVGLYDSLSDWYLRVGEGRVDSIKAIIEAERASRPVHGVIIFDAGTRIRWQAGIALPGYGGVAGVFSQMLGDERFTPMAALSSEIYLPYSEENPLPQQISTFIKREMMLGDLGHALFGLATQGLDLSDSQLAVLRTSFEEILARYVDSLTEVGAARPREFYRKVVSPFRKAVRKAKLRSARDKLLARLSLRHYHMRNWVTTFFDYALIVDSFLKAHVAELEQVSGAHQKFFVVKMAQGDRKQLMYDLTARIVDAESLPINMIIVSPWARTGWNVIKPNVLIDATATRNVTAWQQLRGRAMRAMRTWTNDCYRLVLLLLGSGSHDLHEDTSLPEDVGVNLDELQNQSQPLEVLDEASKTILLAAHHNAQEGLQFSLLSAASDGNSSLDQEDSGNKEQTRYELLTAKIESGIIAEFTPEERMQLVSELMLMRNKVTHIFELVKAYGSTAQIHYDRTTHQWQRTESISLKHAREYAVSPLSGAFAAGTEHAPMFYSGDPRKDAPSDLEVHLISALQHSDTRIIKGWLNAISSSMHEEVPLE
jgi:superfamily II DNA or RNA helicase